MIMDFILFLLTVHEKKIAKSCYSVHSSMRASNIISPEGKVKGSLSGYLFKIVPSKCKAIYRFVITYVIVYANSNRSSLASKYDILMTVVPTIA